MEKFGTWRDASTGIQPFLPYKPPRISRNVLANTGLFLKDYLLGPVLAIIRILLIIIVTGWLFLMNVISNLLPIPVIKRGFIRYVNALGARAILLFMGFWWIRSDYITTKKGRQTVASNSWPPGSYANSGDIIVSNFTSYVEILYFGFRFSPQFTQIYTKKSGNPSKPTIQTMSLFSAILSCFSSPNLDSADLTVDSLENTSKKAATSNSGPIVLFPEGTTTNGNTILKFTPVFEGFSRKEAQIIVVAFKYEFEHFSPAYTTGNPFVHLFRLCSQFNNQMDVRYLMRNENPNLSQPPPQEVESTTDPLGSQISGLIANLLRIRKAQLTVEDKIEFLEYFNARKKGYNSNKKPKGE